MLGLHFGPVIRQYYLVITVNFSMLCTGMAVGWSSPVLVKLANASATGLEEPVNERDGSWIVSSAFLTCTIAVFMAPYLLDNIGRKYSIILASVPHIIGSVIIVFAKEVWVLIMARTLVGASMTINFSASPLYAAEIASKEIRGSLGTILQIAYCMGVTIMLVVGPFVSYLAMHLMYASVVVLTTIPILFLPDSPYYLYSKGRIQESLAILTKVRGSETLAKQEISEYHTTPTKVSKLSLLKDIIFLKTIVILVLFVTFTQITGSNAMEFYLQPILESTKTTISSEIASAVVGVIRLLGALLTATITDRFGRKPILVWSYLGMTVGMVGLGLFFHISSEVRLKCPFVNYIPIICLVLTTYCNSAGQGSLLFPMASELLEGPTRALGLSITFFAGSLFTFVTAKYLAAFLELAGPAVAYWIFGGVCIVSALFSMFILPETRGKTIAEIQVILGRKM